MTAIGVANVVLGGGGCLAVLFAGWASMVALAILLQSQRRIAVDLGDWNTRAWVALLLAPVAGGLDAILLAAGIQVLRRAPSGRTLSLVYAIPALPLGLLDLWLVRGGGPLFPLEVAISLVSPIYSCALIALFLRPSWRKAFAAH